MHHHSHAERTYQDVEGVLYHYPRVYWGRVTPYSQFVYYRPLGRSMRRVDSKTYFGHGTLGVPYADMHDDSRRFVDVIQYEAFPRLVNLEDADGRYYETGSSVPFQAQAAVREITDVTYHRMLAAGGVAMTGVSLLPNTLSLPTLPLRPGSWPMDPFRTIVEIPRGAGYVPRSGDPPDVYEAAALQERARADHQGVLASIASLARERGAQTLYNNNVDLVVRFANERILVEAKSLNDPRDAIDRMRYGMGQLMDYGIRYRAELAGATPMLAFGRPPDAATSWIAEILNENGVAFVCSGPDGISPFNALATASTLFG